MVSGRGDAGKLCGNWPTCAAGWPRAEDALADALAAMESAEGAFDAASDRLDAAARALPPAPGLPAVPSGKPARRKGARLARILRTRWWPRFLLLGVTLVIVAATTAGGAAGAWLGLSGAAIITVAVFRAASMTPEDYRREPPIPPGGLSGP